MLPPVFPFRPNWARPVLERLEWLTDLVESHDATESRAPLRSFPRRSMEYALLVQTSALQRLDVLLWAGQGGQYVVPMWFDPQLLAAPLAEGADEIVCDTEGYDYHAGGLAVLWRDDATYEAVELVGVSPTALTLAAPTALAWPARTRVFPARLGRLPEDVGLGRSNAAVAAGTLRFELDNSAHPPAPGAVEYRGMDVHLRRPNWQSGIAQRYQRKIERLDYDLGAVFVDDLSGLARTVATHRYTLESRADLAAYRGWLHARAGRAHAYWQPQWSIDLTASAPVTSGQTSLTVQQIGSPNYHLQPGRQDVALRHRRTEQWAFRRVTGITQGSGTETLQLDGAVGFNASPRDLIAHWLVPARLDADAVEIAWHSAGAAVSLFDVRSVRQ